MRFVLQTPAEQVREGQKLTQRYRSSCTDRFTCSVQGFVK